MTKYFLVNICMFFIFSATLIAQTQREILLWPDGAPGAKANAGDEQININKPTGDHLISNIHNPSITPFLPDTKISKGIAVIIAPGGGHRELWIDHEGYNIAKKLRDNGIAAFVLKYRLAKEEGSVYSVDQHSVKDMLRAIRIVRSRSVEWHIDPTKIGIIGFSAGGEVAAVADMHADSGLVNAIDPIDKVSSKPNFQALIYPGRMSRIIPTKQSAPAFLLCGYNDRDDISKSIAELYLKFKEINVPAELHIYANAGHGFGIRSGDKGASSHWLEAFMAWLADLNTDIKQ